MTAFDSPGQDQQLTPKQRALIAALLREPTQLAAAKAAGIAEKTMYRWLSMPHVQAAYKAAQQELFDEAIARLRDLVPLALTTLRRHINAEVEPTAATQLRAALGSIEQAVQLHKVAELEARLEELEAQFGIKGR